jgi:hypothetical protein
VVDLLYEASIEQLLVFFMDEVAAQWTTSGATAGLVWRRGKSLDGAQSPP